MIEEIALSAVAGGLVKLCDDIADRRLKVAGGYLFAAVYGTIIAYIATQTPLSSLWLGAVVAMVLMNKIDNGMHALAVLIVAAAVLLFNVNSFDFGYFLVFMAAAGADEIRFERKDIIARISAHRLWLVAASLLASLLSGYWLYFFSIASFDIAYSLIGRTLIKFYPERG
jgi:hypothetical protein